MFDSIKQEFKDCCFRLQYSPITTKPAFVQLVASANCAIVVDAACSLSVTAVDMHQSFCRFQVFASISFIAVRCSAVDFSFGFGQYSHQSA